MPLFDYIQSSFLGGEVSPRMLGRVELDLYKAGCSTLENFIVTSHGGVSRRGGSKFIVEAKYKDKETRLQSMSYRDEAEFVLEFGDYYIRFYTNQTQLVRAYTVWETAKDYVLGDLIIDVGGYYRRCVVAHTSGTLNTDIAAGYWVLTDGATDLAYEIPTTYTEDEVKSLHFASDENHLFITHGLHLPARLSFTAPSTFVLSDLSYIAFDLVPSTAGTGYTLGEIITVTQAGASGATLEVMAIDVGTGITRLRMLTQGVGYEVANALATTSSGAGANAKVDCIGDSPPAEWHTANYPALCWFYEQRLMFAATPNEPNAVWGSHSGDFYNFTLGTGLDNEGINVRIKRANRLVWVVTKEMIMLGATNGEFILSAANPDEAMTPGNIRPILTTSYGSAEYLDASAIDSTAIFVQRGKRKVRRLQYDLASSKYIATDISLIGEHMTQTGIIDISHMNEPESIIWLLRTDGKLAANTFDPDNNIYAWHRHSLGGTGAIIGSITASKGSTYINKDELWMLVNRTINGDTVRYIEILTQGLLPEEDQEDAFFVDCGVIATGVNLTEVTGLDHLEGETVSILADGAVQPNQTVVNGTVPISPVANKVHVGIPYVSTLITLPIDGGNPIGTSHGRQKNIEEISFRLYRSLGMWFGDPEGTLDEYFFGPPDLMDNAIELYTGDTEMRPFPGVGDMQGLIKVQQTYPSPLTILAIMVRANTQV